MQKLKIVIELIIKGDPKDLDTLKEDIYQRLQGDMEEDDLAYEIVEDEDEEEDDYENF